MKALLTIPVLFLASVLLADDTKSDQEQIQGTWKILSFEINGNQAPDEVRQSLRMTFQADKLIVKSAKGDRELQFSLDPFAKPKSIDIVHPEGDNKGKTSKGIYNLEGGKLTFCMGGPDANRPTEFRAGERVVLAIFERAE